MSAIRLASRYAKSLIDLGIEKNLLEQINTDIETINSALKSRDLSLFIKSPIIHPEKKASVLKQIFGDKLSLVTSSFIDIVLKKHREFYLPDIVSSFRDQYGEHKGIVKATLTVAVALTNDSILNDVKAIILKDTGKNDVTMQVKVDPKHFRRLYTTVWR
jgi:F-type H+-transporting ATPase subunit delta